MIWLSISSTLIWSSISTLHREHVQWNKLKPQPPSIEFMYSEINLSHKSPMRTIMGLPWFNHQFPPWFYHQFPPSIECMYSEITLWLPTIRWSIYRVSHKSLIHWERFYQWLCEPWDTISILSCYLEFYIDTQSGLSIALQTMRYY